MRMQSKIHRVIISLVFALVLAVLSAGCIYEIPVHPESHSEGSINTQMGAERV